MSEQIKDGVYFDMPHSEYLNARGFSASGAKEILISPLDYWMKARKPVVESDKSHFVYGTALHKLLLEGEEAFEADYIRALNRDEYSDLPASNDDLKQVCKDHGLKVSGTKADLVSRIRESAPDVELFADVESEYNSFAAGRKILTSEMYDDLMDAEQALKDHDLGDAFQDGKSEVSVFWTDENGIRCKARFDYIKSGFIIDLKSFSRRSNRPVDDVINQEIVNYNYLIQAAHYKSAMNFFASQCQDYGNRFDFVFLFVESGPIKNVRARLILETQEYWPVALSGLNKAKRLYLEYKEKFGNNPWIERQQIDELLDIDMPAYYYK